ncbi:MAG: 2-succinyl-5-enolpyruvyl-6-hydroxy-3-cyclohexene-1-carboxylic-acid synthase [Anaerolineaceae bacterium]|nr:2-succinyl-5-enolpyruvyl-6-hydroxy-3-cyclohexene-1-carboxylic-acid synthase [Anaerolineaceae bacterium]
MSNRNVLWTDVFVDELARAGLRAVCIAPGSRSTPLTLAFARHGGVKIYTHLDERSAAFFALGLALASDEPVALVCTSGTAAANFFPAIVEAHMSRVPLIVLTADRPPELRHSGANQTIDQIKMYGAYALWSVDAPLPEANPSALTIRSLRTLANRAYAKANGIRKGVVHINMPFRKPLEPIPVAGDVLEVPVGAEAREGNYTRIHATQRVLAANDEITWLRQLVREHERGIIICGGGLSPADGCMIAAAGLATGYPVLAESYSHVRHDHQMYGGYEFYAGNVPAPDIILRFGNVPISKPLNDLIVSSQAKAVIHISPDGVWSDDNHLVTDLLPLAAANAARALEDIGRGETAFTRQYAALEAATWQVVDSKMESVDYFDGAAVYDVVDLIPPESTLFVGNSLPVRLLDQFGKPSDKRIYVYANRGASGIDGNISSALGAGAARPDKPLVAIVGDITFYHDMNGLLAVHRNGIPITIVLLNNDGGGIFHRLPIKDFDPAFTDLFVMPHGLEFEHTARMYGLDYVRADDRESFRQAFSESVNNRLSRVIEVRTDVQHDLKRRQEIMEAVQQRIAGLGL